MNACAIDWTALGTWASFFAVAVAAWIAWKQLGGLNSTERMRITQDTFGLFFKPVHLLVPGARGTLVTFQMSPSQALGQLEDIIADAVILAELNDGTANAGRKARASIYYEIVTNFFSPIPHLLQRDKIDEDYFFEQMEYSIRLAHNLLPRLTAVREREYALKPISDTFYLLEKWKAKQWRGNLNFVKWRITIENR